MGSIIPIHKSGDKDTPNNYRGICLLSCLGKLFTAILNNRLNLWAEAEGSLNDAQYGFRRGRGTVDCVFILQGIIDLLIADGKKLYTAMVDLEKCYDYLDRSAVFCKLLKEGVSSKCVNIFKDMEGKKGRVHL